jgi:hypothetical protein
MDDEDDDAQGLSPTSILRKNRKRKYYSDDEEEDEEQEDSLNIELARKVKQDPVTIASVQAIPSSQNAHISCGKAPMKRLAPKKTL